MDLDALRQEIEAFLRQLAEEEYLQQAGLKSESQLAIIYQQHEHLFHPTRLEELRAAMGDGGAANGPRLLLEFLTHACLEAKVQDVTDRFLREEATAFVSVEERTIPSSASRSTKARSITASSSLVCRGSVATRNCSVSRSPSNRPKTVCVLPTSIASSRSGWS